MNNELKPNREVKSSAFTAFFSVPENAAKLYAALSEQEVSPKDISFTTLSGVLFMARKNDMAFQVQNRVLVISEHQSTINANMPLRDAIYYGRTMEKLVDKKALYKAALIKIPTPEFYVFYNGKEDFPAEKTLKLSDSYLEETGEIMLELIVKVININLPVNHPILQKCRPLYEYAWFIQKIREYQDEGLELAEAIVHTMNDCKKEGIMVEFLEENGSEAMNMLFTEFNMEDALDVRYEEGMQAGEQKGISLKLIEMVCKKMKKEKSLAVIVEELEEEETEIKRIYEAALKLAPDYDIDKIYKTLHDKINQYN